MKEEMLALKQQLAAAFRDMLGGAVELMPRVILGVVLVLVALVVAKGIEKGVAALLARVRLNELVQRTGLAATFERFGIRQPPSLLLARILYFLLLFLFARMFADALGLAPVSQALGAFLAYVPNLVSAALIFLFGSLAGQLASRAVTTTATNAGIAYGASLGSLVYALIVFLAGIMALGQLRFDTDIVRLVTVGVLAAIALAFGLSFGLGTREITRNILAGFYARKVFRVGEEMEIRGERGRLKAITPTQTLLENGERTIAVANSVYLDEIVKQ